MSSTLSKNSLRRPDGFLVNLRKYFDDLAKHSRAVVVGIVVVLVAAAVGTLVMGRNEGREDQAREALYRARTTLKKELVATVPAEAPAKAAKSADEGDKATKETKPATLSDDQRAELATFKKINVDQQLGQGLKNLLQVESDFPKTRAAQESRLMIGDLYLDHGDPTKAVAWYTQALNFASGALEKALVYSSLGHALEDSGKRPEAIQNYEKAIEFYSKANPKISNKSPKGAETDAPSMKGDFLLAIARCYEGMNDKAKATSTYDQIIASMPNSKHAKAAELFKTQLL